MEAWKIIKRLVIYGVFFAAATLFVYFSIIIATAQYGSSPATHGFSALLTGVYLPLIYAFVSLGAALAVQFFVLGVPAGNERKIYDYALVFFFGIVICFLLVALAGGLSYLSSSASPISPAFLVIGLLPPFFLSAAEEVIAIRGLVSIKKAETAISDKKSS